MNVWGKLRTKAEFLCKETEPETAANEEAMWWQYRSWAWSNNLEMFMYPLGGGGGEKEREIFGPCKILQNFGAWEVQYVGFCWWLLLWCCCRVPQLLKMRHLEYRNSSVRPRLYFSLQSTDNSVTHGNIKSQIRPERLCSATARFCLSPPPPRPLSDVS